MWLWICNTEEGNEYHIRIFDNLPDYQHITASSTQLPKKRALRLIYTFLWFLSIWVQALFKWILSMIPIFLYKYLNFTVNTTDYTCHTTNINYKTNYSTLYYLTTCNTFFQFLSIVDCHSNLSCINNHINIWKHFVRIST